MCLTNSSSDIAVLVGLTAAVGTVILARGVGLTGGVVIFLSVTAMLIRYSALVLDELHGDGGLVCVVQQAAIGQADGDSNYPLWSATAAFATGFLVSVSRCRSHSSATYGLPLLSVVALCKIFSMAVSQLFATHGTLLVLAALGIGGRLLVIDPVTGLMTSRSV